MFFFPINYKLVDLSIHVYTVHMNNIELE